MASFPSLKVQGSAHLEAREFIDRHGDKITPLLNDSLKTAFARGSDSMGTETCENILRTFATQVLICNKPAADCVPEARHLLLSFSDPGSSEVLLPLLPHLLSDPRCRTISVFADGIGLQAMLRDYSEKFTLVDAPETPLYVKLIQASLPMQINSAFSPEMAAARALDDIIVAPGSLHSPHRSLIYSAVNVLNAGRTFAVMDGWGSQLLDNIASLRGQSVLPELDGVFVNDALAQAYFEAIHGEAIRYRRIFSFGTPQLENSTINAADAQHARVLLGLKEDEIAILYAGTILDPQENSDEAVPQSSCNPKVLAQVLESIREAQQLNPNGKLVLMYRPHPRDSDRGQQAVADVFTAAGVKISDASSSIPCVDASLKVIRNGAIAMAAADCILSPNSTMVFTAVKHQAVPQTMLLPLRGISDQFFEYYNPINIRNVGFAATGAFPELVSSGDELTRRFAALVRNTVKTSAVEPGITRKIVDSILECVPAT